MCSEFTISPISLDNFLWSFNLRACIFIIAVLLIVSGNVELNPGPMKKCPKCEKMMPTRSNNCRCGHLLCYVAARVLHFSAFIYYSRMRNYFL